MSGSLITAASVAVLSFCATAANAILPITDFMKHSNLRSAPAYVAPPTFPRAFGNEIAMIAVARAVSTKTLSGTNLEAYRPNSLVLQADREVLDFLLLSCVFTVRHQAQVDYMEPPLIPVMNGCIRLSVTAAQQKGSLRGVLLRPATTVEVDWNKGFLRDDSVLNGDIVVSPNDKKQ